MVVVGGVGVWSWCGGVWCGEVYLCGGVGEADAMDSARSLKAWNSAGPLSWTSGWLSSQALCMDVGRSTCTFSSTCVVYLYVCRSCARKHRMHALPT